jgi:hypothetical protein
MNIESLKFQLREMSTHLQSTLADLDSGKIGAGDDHLLAIDLGHLLDHLCLAWNSRNIALEDFETISDTNFATHASTVPNFGCSRSLGSNAF